MKFNPSTYSLIAKGLGRGLQNSEELTDVFSDWPLYDEPALKRNSEQ